MSKLNQIIAIEKGAKGRAQGVLSGSYQRLQKEELLKGTLKDYRPAAEDGETLPSESKNVQVKVPDEIAQVRTALSELFDVTAAKEWSNCEAKADILIEGTALLKDVPVSYLLFLEKSLTDIGTYVDKLPLVDPARTWEFDASTNQNRSEVLTTTRLVKEESFIVVEGSGSGDGKVPPQVKPVTKDRLAGFWDTTHFSGAVTASERAEMSEKVRKLKGAVIYAREQANSLEATEPKPSKIIFDYIFGA